jgi:hypothetical protein
MSPGEEGETPREGKAHEGIGSRYGLIRRSGVRTLAGSKALKWGHLLKGRVKHNALPRKGHHLDGLDRVRS